KAMQAVLEEKRNALEKEIAERRRMEREVERVHRQLLETSRAAGMAEVATSVLHNVGNVLNSINVSTSLLLDKFKSSRAGFVSRTADLMKEQAGNLAEFILRDPKGQQLPAYLANLGEQLKSEQTLALEELSCLQKNVEHVKEIVAMQQSHGRVLAVITKVSVLELVEDALRIHETALARHGVNVLREYGAAREEILVDRHKVLQILVNLISNSKHACDQAQRRDKQITVRVTEAEKRIRISVIDNGVGIARENLARVFNYGFTTRKSGHGLGLHSGALAAKELGGALLLHSDGPGTGATFTLEIPLQPPGCAGQGIVQK
ncbi:MAG TPA: HAMP domain-containing sensor histidine kinase, partial [Candidatus Acidoferrales bacterium]|nr:HAMP domain-containing sensor histidine kinase [Candidatus Acidoferrales bacterium]